MTSAVEVNSISKRFGTHQAVAGLSFVANKGDVLGFLGPNGAGKSTTMKMCVGFLPPDAGSVSITGIDIWQTPEVAKAKIGYVPEGAPLYADMTVQQFLRFVAQLHLLIGKQGDRAVDAAVEKTELASVLHQKIDTLSKGFKRRVALAQALIHDPEILILDEPTDGLDPNQKHQVRQLIRDMQAEKSIIISTHILEEVEAVCNRVMIINKGQLVLDSTPHDLLAMGENQDHILLHIETKYYEDFTKSLRALEIIADVKEAPCSHPHLSGMRIYPKDEAVILDQVHGLLAEKRIRPVQIKVETTPIDEIFRRVTAGELT